jgi:hypothetical protein
VRPLVLNLALAVAGPLALAVLVLASGCKKDPVVVADAGAADALARAPDGGRGADALLAGASAGGLGGDGGGRGADGGAAAGDAGAGAAAGADGGAGAAGGPPAAGGAAEVAKRTQKSIYMLAAKLPNGKLRGICSAFAVAPKVLATNAHCIDALQEKLAEGGNAVVVQNGVPGTEYKVLKTVRHPGWRSRPRLRLAPKVAKAPKPKKRPAVAKRPARPARKMPDVALVFLSTPVPDVAQVASRAQLEKLGPGTMVHLFGFPGRFMRPEQPVASFTSGTLSRLTTLAEDVGAPATRRLLAHTAATLKGSSGSPIFDDTGLVIGINAGNYLVTAQESVQRRKVKVAGRRSEFRYGMRADLLLDLMARQGVRPPAGAVAASP